MDWGAEELKDLEYAKSLLEHHGLAIKIANVIGVPIEKGFNLLPEGWSKIVSSATEKALQIAIHSAILTMNKTPLPDASNMLHKFMAAGSGAAGGFLGFPALPFELPISTTIMLRSIADIARSEGLYLTEPRIKIGCMEVFALGGPGSADDAVDAGYFAVRSGLARVINEASRYIVKKGLSEKGAPVVVKLIAQISMRFGVQVSEKLAAQAIPVIGAAGGALVNTLFIDHFQNMARGHFIVLRLEKKYGSKKVKEVYDTL